MVDYCLIPVPTVGVKSPEDIVIVWYGFVTFGLPHPHYPLLFSALRTPICKGNRGGFKKTPPEELLSAVLRGIIEKTKINPKLIQDVVVGNVLNPGAGATISRMASLYSG